MDKDSRRNALEQGKQQGGQRDRTLECALPGCAERFAPANNRQLYCTPQHRQQAYLQRQAREGYGVDVPLEELRDIRDTALTELRPISTAVTERLDGLVTRFENLEAAAVARIAASEADTESERARADEATARADAADARAEAADALAETANQRAAQADQARRDAVTARRAAEKAQQVTESQLGDLAEERNRAQRQADEATARAATAENQVATLTAERDALTDRLSQLGAQLDDERDRANQAQEKVVTLHADLAQQRQQHADALAQARAEAQAEIDRIRAQAQTEITEARDAADVAVAAARRELTEKTSEYTAALGTVSERIGGLEERARHAQQARATTADQLQGWHDQLAEALQQAAHDDNPAVLQQAVTRLIAASTGGGTD